MAAGFNIGPCDEFDSKRFHDGFMRTVGDPNGVFSEIGANGDRFIPRESSIVVGVELVKETCVQFAERIKAPKHMHTHKHKMTLFQLRCLEAQSLLRSMDAIRCAGEDFKADLKAGLRSQLPALRRAANLEADETCEGATFTTFEEVIQNLGDTF